LHFSPRLMQALSAAGIAEKRVRLNVGAGTFRPLTDDQIAARKLHEEWREISPDVARALNDAKTESRRIIPVGTTALRTLESAADLHGRLHAVSGPTDIFLQPGDRLRITDALITNFHLPGSSLFRLVCALMGTDVMRAAYAHAIANAYRFYSYGDACLLLP
jgi:S-adenosylmethionine:tRNA ribosyltransferase-isomerase